MRDFRQPAHNVSRSLVQLEAIGRLDLDAALNVALETRLVEAELLIDLPPWCDVSL
jgi:hypothetical protein